MSHYHIRVSRLLVLLEGLLVKSEINKKVLEVLGLLLIGASPSRQWLLGLLLDTKESMIMRVLVLVLLALKEIKQILLIDLEDIFEDLILLFFELFIL